MIDITTYILAKGYTNAAIASSGGGKPTEVDITDVSGTIPAEQLDQLTNKGAIIVLEDKVYRLSRIESNNYKYISSVTNGAGQTINMTELDIDKETGEFFTKQIVFNSGSVEYLEERLNSHISDNTVHITATERNYWNNKVSDEAETISGEQDYKLKLKH